LFVQFGREIASAYDWKFGREPRDHAAGHTRSVEAMTLCDACGERAAAPGAAQKSDGAIGADPIDSTAKLRQREVRRTGNADSHMLAVAAHVDERDLPAEEAVGRICGLD
jgi:hypothetical protein